MTRKRTPLLLLNLSTRRPKDPAAPPGLASIAATAHTCPYLDVRELCLRPEDSPVDNAQKVLAEVSTCGEGAWVAAGGFVFNEKPLGALCQEVRASGFQGHIVLGGPSVSFAAKGDLEGLFPGVDYFIRGYGEQAMTELVSSGGTSLPTGVHRAGLTDFGLFASANLTTLPSPILAPRRRPIGPHGFIWWETKRSCPFRCAFCQHFAAGGRPQCPQFPLSRLRAEVEVLADESVRHMKVIDPCFNDPRTHYKEAMALLGQVPTLETLAMEAHFHYVDEDFAMRSAQLGATLEFGLQTIIPEEERAIRRINDKAKAEKAARMLRNHAVRFTISLIYGLPLQKPESFQRTIDYARSLGPDQILAFPLGLYRGSGLEREKEKWGLIVENKGLPLVVSSNSFTRDDYYRMEEMANAL